MLHKILEINQSQLPSIWLTGVAFTFYYYLQLRNKKKIVKFVHRLRDGKHRKNMTKRWMHFMITLANL